MQSCRAVVGFVLESPRWRLGGGFASVVRRPWRFSRRVAGRLFTGPRESIVAAIGARAHGQCEVSGTDENDDSIRLDPEGAGIVGGEAARAVPALRSGAV